MALQDDVFVFTDAFRQTEALDDLRSRLSESYRKAGTAMVIYTIEPHMLLLMGLT